MTDHFEYDVAIVGGGPAGSSTALHLVRKEGISPRRIVVLDKAKFPRDKPCAGAVSQLGVDVLAALGIQVTVPSVTMTGVRVLAGETIGETIGHMGIVIRRTEFDSQLLETARRDGVDVRDGEGLSAIERKGGHRGGFVLTTTSGSKIATRFVVAADGAGSTTRKLLGIREQARKGHLYVLDTEPLACDEGVTRGLVDFDLSIVDDGLEGYYWDFPTVIDGARQVSRGIYHVNLSRPDAPSGESVKDVLARSLARRGIDIATVKLRPFSTRPFVARSIGWRPGIVLVGEAFGIDRTTGEGIAQALEMGRMAASHLAVAVRTGHPRFEAYERDVRTSTTGRHFLQSAWLAQRVYSRTGYPARRYLLRSSYGRTAAIKWYRGDPLPLLTQLRLGFGLAASAFGSA
ncbi:MAG TPA: NAD(P)/FAD-dependent oxidoreductase [Labilithrix sp.]|nr:NAD(P)/FAD-dependent oxidoreductase [Labilithrix sp.]